MASYSSNNNNNNINNSEPQETETERWKSERPSSRTAVPGCLATFWAEVNPCQDWYLVSDTVTGRKLDVQHTFGPVGRYALLLKLLGTGFCISTLIYSLIDAVNSSVSSWFWWFAYYPNWSIIISCLYQILSFSNSLFSERITQPPARVTGCCKVTWILFSMASNANLVAVLVFWLLLYNPNDESSTSAINYLNIASHGGVALVVLLDGLLINRIPLRWMHFWGWVLLYNTLYMTWTIIQSDLVLGIGNPIQNDNDIIYSALSWSDDWQTALFSCVIIMFAISPAIYTILWLISLYGLTWIFCCWGWNDQRRYVDSHLDKLRNEEDKKKKKKNNKNPETSSRIFDPNNEDGDLELEEVSIFASTTSPQK